MNFMIDRPRDAYKLSDADLKQESMKHGLMNMDFIDDQRKKLQSIYDQEYEEYKANYESTLQERLEKEKLENEMRLQKLLEDKEMNKEQIALSNDLKTAKWIVDLKNNYTDSYVVLRIAPVLLRSIVGPLETNTSLVALDLSRCGIDDLYAKLLFRSLKRNNVLQKLELISNEIGSDSLNILSETLKINTSLVLINLENNPITVPNEDGLLVFFNNLKEYKSLNHLILTSTNLSDNCGEFIIDGLQQNHVITHLELTRNTLSKIQLSKIADLLERNRTESENKLKDERIHRRQDRDEIKKQAEVENEKRLTQLENEQIEQRKIQRSQDRLKQKEEAIKKLQEDILREEEEAKLMEIERKRLEDEKKKKKGKKKAKK